MLIATAPQLPNFPTPGEPCMPDPKPLWAAFGPTGQRLSTPELDYGCSVVNRHYPFHYFDIWNKIVHNFCSDLHLPTQSRKDILFYLAEESKTETTACWEIFLNDYSSKIIYFAFMKVCNHTLGIGANMFAYWGKCEVLAAHACRIIFFY